MGCHAAYTPDRLAGVGNGSKCKLRKPCGPGKALCPVAIGDRLKKCEETNKTLEQQLVSIEGDVKTIQTELQTVHDESNHLKQHQNQHVILCATPLSPSPCLPCSPCIPCPPCPALVCCSQNLRRTREKYDQLLNDFYGRRVEIGILEIDNNKAKKELEDAEEAKRVAEEKVKELQRRLNDYKSLFGENALEGLSELEKELELAKRKLRNQQEQLEDLQRSFEDQRMQIRDYQIKCCEAQQIAQEQKKQIEILEQDADKVNEQVGAEIERLKDEFEKKLEEFKPLADELRVVQLATQEAQKMYVLALKDNEDLTKKVDSSKKEVADLTAKLEDMKAKRVMGDGENEILLGEIADLQKQVEELQAESAQLMSDLERMKEAAKEAERTAQEKAQEIAQLTTELEAVPEESARQATRSKALCDRSRRFLQERIKDLKEQLAQSRIQAYRAQRDRDEIRVRMQTQVENLRDNSLAAQMRVRNLQAHLKYLEKSYKDMYPDPINHNDDPCFCGVEL